MSANPIQREKRRRRVLRDEPAEVRKSDRPQTTSGRKYSDGALEDSQPRITDCLPKANWPIGLLFLGGLTTVVTLVLAFGWRVKIASAAGEKIAMALDISRAGSIATWFNASLAMSCAGLSLMIYNVRRHRIADYRGRYRLWTWAAAVFVLASLDSMARLSHLAAVFMFELTGGAVVTSASTWVFVGWSLLALSVAIPMLLELRMSQLTMAGLVASGLAYAASGLLYIRCFQGSNAVRHVMLQIGSLQLAHLCMCASLLAFARLVFLDAQGLLERKQKEQREITPPEWAVQWRTRQAQKRTERLAAKQARKQSEKPAKPKTKSTKRIKKQKPQAIEKPAVVKVEYDANLDPDVLQNPDLTKAERRKLKKQIKQQRRAA